MIREGYGQIAHQTLPNILLSNASLVTKSCIARFIDDDTFNPSTLSDCSTGPSPPWRAQSRPCRHSTATPAVYGPAYLAALARFPNKRLIACGKFARNVKHHLSMSLKGSMPPSIGHMELLVWMQRADFSEHIQGFKSPGDPLNSSHFDAPNTKSAPTGYRRAPNIISHHYKQQLSAKASIVPKARPIRFR